MFSLETSEFYITNVCNLSCNNCNRYNNFAFTGHQRWHEYAEQYRDWSKRINIKNITIIGGEPLSNPDLSEWVHGLIKLWPDSQFNIVTNGTMLPSRPELYQILKQYRKKLRIDISWHDKENKEKIWQDIENFLEGPVVKKLEHDQWSNREWKDAYNRIKAEHWPVCDKAQDWDSLPSFIKEECEFVHGFSLDKWEKEVCMTSIVDSNGVRLTYRPAWNFTISAVMFDPGAQKIRLCDSEPKKAIEICEMKTCHHFIKGKLYKCGQVGVLPDFVNQFEVDISDDDKKLIESYEPASLEWDDQTLQTFIKNLVDQEPIDQCKFCPDRLEFSYTNPNQKKPKVIKIKAVL